MIGNAGKKIQTMVELAEDLYEKVNQLREQISELRGTVEETNERVTALESEVTEQRALLEAIAEDRGVDVDEVLDGSGTGEEATEPDDASESAGNGEATAPEQD